MSQLAKISTRKYTKKVTRSWQGRVPVGINIFLKRMFERMARGSQIINLRGNHEIARHFCNFNAQSTRRDARNLAIGCFTIKVTFVSPNYSSNSPTALLSTPSARLYVAGSWRIVRSLTIFFSAQPRHECRPGIFRGSTQVIRPPSNRGHVTR